MGMIGLQMTLFQYGLSNGTMIYGPKGICQYFRDLKYITGIKMCHYSVASLESNPEKPMAGVNNDEYLLKLIDRPDALQIFSNWDEFCSSNKV